jgi:deazaflavin-dependent oxidoreductase (nitroreductase family)
MSSSDAFLYLTTTGWRTGRAHEIEIWFTTLDGRYYVIAERGEAHWVQNIRRQPSVTFRVAEARFKGTARIVDPRREKALHQRVAELSRAKYGWGEGVVVELVAGD